MNFTWYASAYDNNDSLHRVLTIVAMSGSLIMAAGIDRFFQTNSLDMIVAGFVVMRLAMVCFWLRAARHDPERRLTAYRYAVGIAIVQIYWVGLMLAQPIAVNLLIGFYAVGVLFELVVPAYAESNYTTPWHRRHLIERYGLFNIIVLGETLLAGSLAIQRVASDNMSKELIGIAISSLVLMFSLWWVYFSQEEHVAHPRLSIALLWGYGHLLIYMSGAAVGVGVAVLIDVVTGYSSLSKSVGLYTIAVAISGYLFGLWLIRERFELEGTGRYILLLTAVVLLFSPLILPIEGIAALLVIGVAVRNQYACKSVKQETLHEI
jgi:low temperature requirement protein LtrA